MSEDHHDEKTHYYFEVIQTEIDRINSIVSELLVLGKPVAYSIMTCNANDIVSEIEPIISNEKVADSCLIRVADTGTGMTKEHLAQVFNPFFTLKKDGTGLGLTVCRRIIESFGGVISIRSALNEGTTVEIKLPLANGR